MTYTKPGKKPFVQSSHFENENIVVHARVKDRVDADGKRVLFIEEIQSDLASKWREVREDTPEVAAKRAELTEENDRLMREEANARFPLMQMMDRNNHPLVHQHYTVVREQLRHIINLALGRVEADENSPNRKFAEIVKSDQDLMSSARTYIAAVDRRAQVLSDLLALGTERKADPTLPQSPWADPEQYTLMVKSLLREAAVKGYDKLSWTPGWMQARRWNKAGQSVVEAVEWETGSEGGKRITLQMMGGRGIKSIRTDAQGVILSVDTDMGAEGVGQPLTRLLGGDVAKQIMAEEGGKVSGQKITFGSSGYAIAYDGHIRRAVEKLVKPYGARPAEDRSLPDFKGSRKQLTDYLKTLSAAEVIRRATEVQALPPAGLDYARRELRNGTGEDWIISNMTSSIEDGKLREMAPEIDTTDAVWSVEITDDLRKGAGAALVPARAAQRGA
jgi:hypothetical protein